VTTDLPPVPIHERLGIAVAAASPDEVVGTMPMDTLAGFPGIGFTHAQLDDLIARL